MHADLSFSSVYKVLSQHPGLMDDIGMLKAMRFIRLAARLKCDILHDQPPSHPPDEIPAKLSDDIRAFLSSALDLSKDNIDGCWDALAIAVWKYADDEAAGLFQADAKLFSEHGLSKKLSVCTLFAPVTTCTNPLCPADNKLLRRHDMSQKVVLYTLAEGALPAFHTHLYCPTCHTNYHHNFSVFGGVCTYYVGVPDALQVGEHQFIELKLVRLFVTLMLMSWTSATNGARIFNHALTRPENMPIEGWFSFMLRTEHIWLAFLLLCLLEDHQDRDTVLCVPHGGDQASRFTEAVKARNEHFEHVGQPEWGHYCSQCVAFDPGQNGEPLKKLSVIVADGITIGHSTCGVIHCPEPLAKHHDRFCPGHMYYKTVCSIKNCEAPVAPGCLTCALANHMAMEDRRELQTTAMFQLQTCLEHSRVANPTNAFEAVPTDNGIDEMRIPNGATDPALPPITECPQKPSSGNRQLHAQFSRRQTHNEQIINRLCGIIVARATFFGSETVPQMAEMLSKVFWVPGSMPDIQFYDNNCGVYKHLTATNDPLLSVIRLPVDVFHFTCKHSLSDTTCQEHCNPRAFPELLSPDGKTWKFDSSRTEQTNIWLGGYHPMLQEMGMVKYRFFLDEMIMRKNRLTVAKLEKDGACPSYIPGLVFCCP